MYETDLKIAWNAERQAPSPAKRVDLNDPTERAIRQALLADERRRHQQRVLWLSGALVVAVAVILLQAYLIVHAQRIFGC